MKSTHKNLLIAFILAMIVAALMIMPVIVHGQSGASLWKIVSNKVAPVSNSWGLQVPSLNSSGTKCLQVDNTGTVSAYSAGCATGGITDPGSNGWLVRTALNTVVARTFSAGTGISITNTNGVSGNPVFTNTGVTSFNGATGAVTGVSSYNGSTGDVTGVSSIDGQINNFSTNMSMYTDPDTHVISNERDINLSENYTIDPDVDRGTVFHKFTNAGDVVVTLPDIHHYSGQKYSLIKEDDSSDNFCFRSEDFSIWLGTLEVVAGNNLCTQKRMSTITVYGNENDAGTKWIVRQQQGYWYYIAP